MKLDWIWDSRDSGSQKMDKNLEHKWQRKRKIEIKETVRVWKVTEIWNLRNSKSVKVDQKWIRRDPERSGKN